ncbi:MAG TPA: hypothetical protein VHP33_06790 [Polyangiaceae bacterium]|nr:hypothetical protein [Polyangiaceae bacterium]
MSGAPWGTIGAVGSRTLAASDSLLGGVVALLDFQDATPARHTLPSGFASPVSVGGAWPQAWVAGRFELARQNGPHWQTRKLAFPPHTDELLTAHSWLGGRVLGLFVPGNRFSGTNLRGGVFAVVDGPAGGEPELHAATCQDCRSIFALDFAALPTGQVYVVGERDYQATLLEFLPTGGRGIYVPTPSFEPMNATYGPQGRVIALSPQEVYFGAGHRLPIVYRYDGREVKALPVPPGLPAAVEASQAGQPLGPVVGLAARPGGELWAIFGLRTGYPTGGVPLSRLYRYDRAGTWQGASFPPGPDGRAPDLVDVAVSNDSVWVLGHFGDAGVLYRSALPASAASVAPNDPPVSAAPQKPAVALSYGASRGSFGCAGGTCGSEQVCCEFYGFQRCVTPNVALPVSLGAFVSARAEIAKSCRTDDFAEPPWQISVCTASSDCGLGQFCVSPDLPGLSVAHCAPAVPPEGAESCREGSPCAEPGSVCNAATCVRESAKPDCAGRACGQGQVCCRTSAESPEVTCKKLDQCFEVSEGSRAVLPCTSRQHCASGRRCVLGAWNESLCVQVGQTENLVGVLCASDAECDVKYCPGSGKARCALDSESKLKQCRCPTPKSKP